ncbi:hypothetical protein DEMA109039_09400 [Deinococcus marmoris]
MNAGQAAQMVGRVPHTHFMVPLEGEVVTWTQSLLISLEL